MTGTDLLTLFKFADPSMLSLSLTFRIVWKSSGPLFRIIGAPGKLYTLRCKANLSSQLSTYGQVPLFLTLVGQFVFLLVKVIHL